MFWTDFSVCEFAGTPLVREEGVVVIIVVVVVVLLPARADAGEEVGAIGPLSVDVVEYGATGSRVLDELAPDDCRKPSEPPSLSFWRASS